MRFLQKGGEWRFPGLLYRDDFVLCGEWEVDFLLKCIVEDDLSQRI